MIYTYVATALISAAVAFAGAWQVQNWRHDAMDKARAEAALETQRLHAKQSDSASEGHEKTKVQIRTEFRDIYHEVETIVEKPVYRNVCVDDDGMRLIRKALGDQPATGQPAPAVPGPVSTD